MKIYRINELNDLYKQRRIKQTTLTNESISYDNAPSESVIVFPNRTAWADNDLVQLEEILERFLMEHSLADDDAHYDFIQHCICGEYTKEDDIFDCKSPCIVLQGITSTDILKDAAETLMANFGIERVVLLADAADFPLEIERTEEMREGRIQKLDEI